MTSAGRPAGGEAVEAEQGGGGQRDAPMIVF
jgi:hypothetical protein